MNGPFSIFMPHPFSKLKEISFCWQGPSTDVGGHVSQRHTSAWTSCWHFTKETQRVSVPILTGGDHDPRIKGYSIWDGRWCPPHFPLGQWHWCVGCGDRSSGFCIKLFIWMMLVHRRRRYPASPIPLWIWDQHGSVRPTSSVDAKGLDRVKAYKQSAMLFGPISRLFT